MHSISLSIVNTVCHLFMKYQNPRNVHTVSAQRGILGIYQKAGTAHLYLIWQKYLRVAGYFGTQQSI